MKNVCRHFGSHHYMTEDSGGGDLIETNKIFAGVIFYFFCGLLVPISFGKCRLLVVSKKRFVTKILKISG